MRIGQMEYEINPEKIKEIETNISKYTCKTNVSPHLLFRSPYTEDTSRVFIGNWMKDGFWITRYRKQFINFRADIIAKGNFINTQRRDKLVFKFSLGFSSILGGFFIILFLAYFLISLVPIYLAFSLPIIAYVFMTNLEIRKAKSAIERYLLDEQKS